MMSQNKHSWWRRIFTIALSFVVISFVVLFLNPATQAQSIWQLLFETEPPSTVPTGRAAGGAGRGPICAFAKGDLNDRSKSVLALMPVIRANPDSEATSNPDVREYVGGYTVAENPTFWFYIPYISEKPNEIRVARFSLLDLAQQPVWNELIAVELLQTPQLIEYQLPQNLEINSLYNWYFSVVCDPEKPSRDSVVRGWVQRVEPSTELQTALRNADLLRRPKYEAYARNGIWFESVNSLVESRRRFSNNNQLRELWIGLSGYFGIPDPEQLDFINPAKIVEREIVVQSQLPARM